jgi:DNA-binding response OmpR family regulator
MIQNKRILIVDDEPDILELLVEMLPECNIVTTNNYETAAKLLKKENFDIAILDIMGVNGYALLDLATSRDITAVMLTAHALSPEDTVKSFRKGAAYYIPKEEIAEIQSFLNDVLDAKEKRKNPWIRWLERFSPYYNRRFGGDWKDRDREFWDSFIDKYRNW